MRPIDPINPTALLSLLAAATLALAGAPARAAESYDNCAYTITSLPVVITTQGTWCVKTDQVTGMTSGDAITVAVNNVTLDCNGFKVGDLAAGPDTVAIGIRAVNRVNTTIRGCTVRGFSTGIALSGSGHIVEDNRIEGSRATGIETFSDGAILRRNMINDTGGSTVSPKAISYGGDTDIIDNVITDVFPVDSGASATVYGIHTTVAANARIRGNALRGLTTLESSGLVTAIRISVGSSEVVDNFLVAVPGPATLTAIHCGGGSGFIQDNRGSGFDFMTSNCPADITGNVLH